MNRFDGSPSALFSPGRTIWKVAHCQRLRFLVDAEAYFVAAAQAFSQAQRRIMIVGWDFDSRIYLHRAGDQHSDALGDYLRRLVDANSALEIYILIWRNSVFYAKNPDIPLLPLGTWWDHPRIHYKLDDHHPVAASHHEKIVVIDDALAFIGGMDLTEARWDEPDHEPDDPRRVTAAGVPYPPIHDIQAMVQGDAARALAELSRARWTALTGDTLPPLTTAGSWPEASVDIHDHDLAIARTRPPYDGQDAIREAEAMNVALLGTARRSIYIETQYFALTEVAKLLCERLEERDGPEIVIVATLHSQGTVEQYVMADNRDRLLAELHRRDRFGRLRTYYSTTSVEPACDIKIHSKLIIVDGQRLRIGSSNFNARSTGLDTECDIVIDAETSACAHAIADLQNRLLAEHTGTNPETFAAALSAKRSLIAAIEAVNGQRRRLVEFTIPESPPEVLGPVANLLDPPQPLDLKYIWDSLTTSPR